MERTWSLLVALALVAVMGCMLLVRWQEPPPAFPTVTPTPSGPNQVSPVAVGNTAATDDPVDESSPPERIQVAGDQVNGGAVADERVAFVEVIVERVSSHQRDAAIRQPFVEVTLSTAAHTHWARTNAQGLTTFEVLGAHGHQAIIACGLGSQITVVLSATKPLHIVLTISPRVLVRGSVVNTTGQAVADATIVLLPWDGAGDDTPAPWRVGRSGADGSFEIGLARGGRLGAHHRVHGPSAMYTVVLPPAGEPMSVLTLPLVLMAVPGQVTGTVRAANGRPVAAAELEFQSLGKAPPGAELRASPQRVRTDAYGAFTVTRLAPGELAYGARASGHGPQRGTLRLEPGVAANLDIELTQPCTLVGTVQTAAGDRVSAAITVGEIGSFVGVRGKTDAAGNFRLVDLAPGDTTLTATATPQPGAARQRVTATQTLHAEPENVWHAVLTSAATAANFRGVLVDAKGTPVAGWRLVTRQPRGAPATTMTAADGTFALNVTPAGQRFDLRAYAPGRSPTRFADVVWRNLDANAQSARWVVTPFEHGRITGRTETQQQAAIPAAIACWHHERAEHVRLVAQADGTVLMPEVPIGTVDLLFEYPGHAGAAHRELVITKAATLDLGTIVLGAGGVLFGNVRGPDGRPPSDCQLTIVRAGQRFHATYADGAFRFPTLPTGVHTLLVQGPELASVSFAITIDGGVEKQQDIELRAGVPRRLRVDLPADGPTAIGLGLRLPNTTCQWMASGGVQRTSNAEDQHVDFVAFMAPGTYEAVAWAVGGWETRQPVTFVVGDDSEVRLVLRRK